jgi:hypothetical protein
VSPTHLFGSRARRPAGSPNSFKRLVNFLNLRKNAKIPLADIGETDEIAVKQALEVETSPRSFLRWPRFVRSLA